MQINARWFADAALLRRTQGCALAVLFIFLSCFAGLAAPTGSTNDVAGVVQGVASFYGKEHHGKKTANGEIFDMYKLTAAHRSLPFGSLVKVTNLTNNRSVIVRINDRGPYIGGRIIDLSQAAAERLEMIRSGISKVKIEVLDGSRPGRVTAGSTDRG